MEITEEVEQSLAIWGKYWAFSSRTVPLKNVIGIGLICSLYILLFLYESIHSDQ